MFGARAVSEVHGLASAAAEFREVEGHWPTIADLRSFDPALPARDPWWHAFRCDTSSAGFLIRSAGVDGVLDTDDDVVSDLVPEPGAPRDVVPTLQR